MHNLKLINVIQNDHNRQIDIYLDNTTVNQKPKVAFFDASLPTPLRGRYSPLGSQILECSIEDFLSSTKDFEGVRLSQADERWSVNAHQLTQIKKQLNAFIH